MPIFKSKEDMKQCIELHTTACFLRLLQTIFPLSICLEVNLFGISVMIWRKQQKFPFSNLGLQRSNTNAGRRTIWRITQLIHLQVHVACLHKQSHYLELWCSTFLDELYLLARKCPKKTKSWFLVIVSLFPLVVSCFTA